MKGTMELAENQEWAKELPEGSYRYPSSWLEERGSWLKDGKPSRSSLEDIEDAEKFAKLSHRPTAPPRETDRWTRS